MSKKEIVIDGLNFQDIEGFYNEIYGLLAKDMPRQPDHDLSDLDDLLRGGLGMRGYGEPLAIVWRNAQKSRQDLGYGAAIKYYQELLPKCHPGNTDSINTLLNRAKLGYGDTLFEVILDIIRSHEQIELILA